MQLTHHDSKFKQYRFPIILVCDNVSNAPNIGSLFRIGDAFGIEKVIFCGETIPIGRRMTKTSRSTEKYVPFEISNSIETVIDTLNNYQLIALEITENSTPLSTLNIDGKKPIALIIGNENFGIHNSILNRCDTVVHIQMYGKNSSMNVVQATSIALYEITNRLKQF
ncbi:TrmH family RNA methyltransferase [Winogradskyella alexanderae]|uniref:TrmH family RNA methyltransferase n=1 Tax=Winogradskyella alexanderae TaxID=2877123 RepID=A0ABS7XTB5_9FLAO|nr:TrmH family RNA methyltransferase [Winogradskyella alexanderae]MCA0132624.1 TrmH family RNA methyltransferase [Winogradskyella alexanderae]